MEKRTLVSARVGLLWIVVIGEKDPTDTDFHAAVKEFGSFRDPSKIRFLTFSEGGHMSILQRKEFTETTGGYNIPLAIITDSLYIRGTGLALSWFNPNLKVFAVKDSDKAYAHLKLTSKEIEIAKAEVARLRRQLRTGE